MDKRRLDRLRREDLWTLAPGLHTDGRGLALLVTRPHGRSWVWRGVVDGKRRSRGLGTLRVMGLDEARGLAGELADRVAQTRKASLVDSLFPAEREAIPGAEVVPVVEGARVAGVVPVVEAVSPTASLTVGDLWWEYVELSRSTWKAGSRTADSWEGMYRRYVRIELGDVCVVDVTRADVLAVVMPVWTRRRATAEMLLPRLAKVFEVAIARDVIEVNPAAGLRAVLPRTRQPVEHHKALAWADVPGVYQTVLGQVGTVRNALALTILTAARPIEASGALAAEFDLDAGLWTVPASRMKMRREHRVPLADQAVEIMRGQKMSGHAFPGASEGSIAGASMRRMVKRLGLLERTTVHGFRSAFRDWAVEQPGYQREIAEMALAHVEGSRAEQAYRRTDFFEARRALMQDWADFLTGGQA